MEKATTNHCSELILAQAKDTVKLVNCFKKPFTAGAGRTRICIFIMVVVPWIIEVEGDFPNR